MLFVAAIGLPTNAAAAPVLWQTNSAGDDIHILDVDTGKLVRRLAVGPEPHGLAVSPDGGTVYVSLEANGREHGQLVWIDAVRLRVVHRLDVGPEPHEIEVTPDGRWIYVPCRDGSFWVVDALSREIVRRISTGGRPHNVLAAPDGRSVYLAPMARGARVLVSDPTAGHELIGEIRFSASVRPLAVSRDGRFLFQQVDGLNGFEVADLSSLERVATVRHSSPLGWFLLPLSHLGWLAGDGLHRCHGIASRPAAGEVWSACGPRLNVHALVEPRFPEIASLELVDDAYWLTFTADGRYAFAAITDRNLVAKVDATEKRVVEYFPVGERPKRNMVLEHLQDGRAR